jgi:hypothetical protein
MSISSRGKSGPAVSSETPTPVLLVCIYDSLVVDITPESIRLRFCKYGPISKVLIFERGEVTKLFLELPNPQLALEVSPRSSRPNRNSMEASYSNPYAK